MPVLKNVQRNIQRSSLHILIVLLFLYFDSAPLIELSKTFRFSNNGLVPFPK